MNRGKFIITRFWKQTGLMTSSVCLQRNDISSHPIKKEGLEKSNPSLEVMRNNTLLLN